MTSATRKLPPAVRRAVADLEDAYADPTIDGDRFDALVAVLGEHARSLTDSQRDALGDRLAAARDRARHARFLADVADAARNGRRELVRVLDTGEEVWHVQLSDGEAVLVVPTITPAMDADLAEALTLSRQATFDGRCPCGGRLTEGSGTMRIEHARRCAAGDASLARLRGR